MLFFSTKYYNIYKKYSLKIIFSLIYKYKMHYLPLLCIIKYILYDIFE